MGPSSILLAWAMLDAAVREVASDMECSNKMGDEVTTSPCEEIIELAIQIGAEKEIPADNIRAVAEMKVTDLLELLPAMYLGRKGPLN